MSILLLSPEPSQFLTPSAKTTPTLITDAGQDVVRKYLEFFAAHIRNTNTREAYLTAAQQFLAWCERHGIGPLERIERLHVAAYIESLTQSYAAPTVKLRLAALRMLFEFLRTPSENPAAGVRGPKHVVRTGRTPVLSAEQARTLLDSITPLTLLGLRDRALIAVMVYTFGRVSAATGLDVEDYYLHSNRRWFRLHEKGGREHALPAHHVAEEYVDAYMACAGIAEGPLFRTTVGRDRITGTRLSRFAAWEMVKRRARAVGLPESTTNHTFRATGITVYLLNKGTIENARNIAAHASIKTTQTYDRRGECVTLEEINRIHL